MTEDFHLNSNPRPDVELTLDDGRVITGSRGAKLEKFINVIQNDDNPLIVGVVLDGSLRELTFPLQHDGVASLITTADADGARIYRRAVGFFVGGAFKD